MSFNRRRTRAENDRSGILRRHERWSGMDADTDPTQLGEGKVAHLQNAVAYGKHVEERSGSWRYSNNAQFGTMGTVYGKHFHKASRRWLFHAGTQLLWSESDMATFTEVQSYAISSFGANGSSNAHTIMQDFLDGVLVSMGGESGKGLYFVNISAASISPATAIRFFSLTAPCPVIGWQPIASSGTPILYRYRYLFTFSRIEDGTVNNLLSRYEGGKVVHESGTRTRIDGDVDYTESEWDLPVSSSAARSIDLREMTTNRTPAVYAAESSPHWTHISIYRTLEIGSDVGITESTGEVNDPEQYVHLADVPIGLNTYSDETSDEQLRMNLGAGRVLLSRGFTPIGVSPKFDGTAFVSSVITFGSSETFLMAVRSTEPNIVDYSQLANIQHAGYHSPLQFRKMKGRVNAIQVNKSEAFFLHNDSVSGADLNAYKDIGDQAPTFQLMSFNPLEPSIGVIDYSSISEIESGRFIARCSDGTIRIWNGTKFGKDLADQSVSDIVKTMVPIGSVGKFFNGAYLLWYRDNSAHTSNQKCLRLSIGESTGMGWSYSPDYLTVSLFHGGDILLDAAGYKRLIMQRHHATAANRLPYWLETYDGPAGSNLFRSVRDLAVYGDTATGTAIVSSIRMPDYTGELEDFDSVHQLTNMHVRAREAYDAANPVFTQETSGFATGFSLDVDGYGNGDLADSYTGCPIAGDIEFHNPPRGSRVSVALTFNAGGWRLVRVSIRIRNIDRKKTDGILVTQESIIMDSLDGDFSLWFSRGDYLDMERAWGRRWVSAGGGFSLAAGPDGMTDSAMQFSGTIGSRISLPAAGYGLKSLTNYAASFWVKNPAVESYIFQTLGFPHTGFNIYFESATVMLAPFGVVPVTNVMDGAWHHFYFVYDYSEQEVKVYQNGVEIYSNLDIATYGLLGGASHLGAPGASLFDFRIYSTIPGADDTLASRIAAINLYRNDILENAGKKVLPY
jgi:hypothetical protein